MDAIPSELIAFVFISMAVVLGVAIAIGAWKIVWKYGGDRDPSKPEE